MSNELTSQDYWQDVMDEFIVPTADSDIVFGALFDAYVPIAPHPSSTVLEIGCVPGMYLGYLAKHFGYRPEGVDYIRHAARMTNATLANFGVPEATVHEVDFTQWNPGHQYDIVASFGFIEHFHDVDVIVDKHIALTKPGGTVILEIPNFGGLQNKLHTWLDVDNLRRHNTDIMHLDFFKTICARHNLDIQYLGYTGGVFDFWWENTHPSVLQKMIRALLKVAAYIGRRIPLHNKYLSPFIIMIAQTPQS